MSPLLKQHTSPLDNGGSAILKTEIILLPLPREKTSSLESKKDEVLLAVSSANHNPNGDTQ